MKKYSYGYQPSKVDLRDYKLDQKRVCAVHFPETFELKMKAVKDQGAVGSCVAHSMCEILEYHEKTQFNTLSTNFIYGIANRLYGSRGPGMMPRDALNIACTYGDMTIDECPGNVEVDGVYKIASDAFNDKKKLASAKRYRIKQYTRLNSADDIKFALMNYGPVLTAIYWHDSYVINPLSGVITFDTRTNFGGHALVIYGWNDKGWLIQNSWGKAWGKAGKFVLPFDYQLAEAWSVVDDETQDTDSPIIVTCAKPDGVKDRFYKFLNKIINFFKNKRSLI